MTPTEREIIDYFLFDAEDVDIGTFSRARTDEVAAHFGMNTKAAYRMLNELAERGVLYKARDDLKRHRGKTAFGWQFWEYGWKPEDRARWAERNPGVLEENPDIEIWYHLTDRARFRLNPNFAPADNTVAIVDRSGRPGIYLGQSVEKWVNGFGYWRPFVVEFEIDPSVKSDPGTHGRYGGELFVPASSFSKLRIVRVIPIDAYAREQYGEPGWIESELGAAFDTGQPLPQYPEAARMFRGYKYEGPDVRNMSGTETIRLKRQLRQVKR